MQRIVDRLAKWKLHRFYAQNTRIAVHLPATAPLTPESLMSFIRLYGTVYIKANTIHTGKAIVKAWRSRNGIDFVRVRGKVQHAASPNDLLKKVRDIAPKELFIVQQGIDLATLQGRPYDIRVMMMRDRTRKWQFAGMVAKVHGPGSIVSNIRRGGGYVLRVQEALRQSGFAPRKIRQILEELRALSQEIIQYSRKYPFYSFQAGIDLAVDTKGKIWIIEVNLHNPSHGLFRQLRDQTDYRRIRMLYRDYRKYNRRLI